MSQDNRKLLELDGRRRISLGALATHNYYLIDVQDDGVIVLTPANVIPVTVHVKEDGTVTTERRAPTNQPRYL
jgi:hypothetical protein